MDLERFVEDCIAANGEADAQAAVTDVLARAVSEPGRVLAALGEPATAGLHVIHRSPTLTMFAATWTPRMSIMPHNHLLWASIGIYVGREDNILWKRGASGRIGACAAKAMFARDVMMLSADAIHSVTNPLPRFTGGIHIYGGDFFDKPRSQWDEETLAERPSDGDVMAAMFEEENRRYHASMLS
jgi:predicted metal-dependent enzyme (double-stranded beta helix superfamily)